MPNRLECPRCGSPNVARLPADPISPRPGYRCANCGAKLRDRGMLVVYLVVLLIAAGVAAVNVYVMAEEGVRLGILVMLTVCMACAGYSLMQLARPAPRRRRAEDDWPPGPK